MKKCYIITIIMSALLYGCAAKTGHQFLEKMSNEEISKKIVKGQTSKEEVRKSFGDPSDVDILPDGKENWTYSFVRSSQKIENYVPVANWMYGGTNDNIRKLKILFSTNGVVEFYAFFNSKGETTRTGIMQKY